MIETEKVLTRHEIVGLLEDAIYSIEQYLGNCHLVDQLSMLAYRIANGEAGFVEDKGDDAIEPEEARIKRTVKSFFDLPEEITIEIVGFRFEESELVGLNKDWPEHYIKLSVAHRPNGEQTTEEKREEEAEKGADIVEATLDLYGGMLRGNICESMFKSIVCSLSDEEVEDIIKWAHHYREQLELEISERERDRKEIERSPITGDSPNTYTHTGTDDEKIMYEDDSTAYNPTHTNLYNDTQESTQKPTDDKLVTLLSDIADHLTFTSNHSSPQKVKNTTEMIREGLEKGILALNIIVELYLKGQKKEERMTEQSEGNTNTNRKKLVYVAGPYQGDMKENIENAEKVSIELIKRGFDVITPHKNTAGYERYEDGNLTRGTWLDMDLNILSRCDAIFVMTNSSTSEGTAAEIAFAKRNNIPFITVKTINETKLKKEEQDLEAFLKLIKEVGNDPELKKKMDEDQRKYGTLTPEDLMKQFTI